MRHPDLAYLSWARSLYGRVRLDLASSNAPSPDWVDLGVTPDELPLLGGDHRAGPPELVELLGQIYGFGSEQVACGPGASGVMALISRALLTPGGDDHVICETPVYEPLRAVPGAMAAEVTFVRRPGPGGSGRLDPGEIVAALRPTTRLVVLTSPHNPSGRRIPPSTLQALGEAAAAVGAVVVVDEVYLDFAGVDAPPAATLSPAIVSVNSVTKVFGLGGLRVGWALCQDQALIRRIRAAFLHDSVNLPGPSVALASQALRRRDLLVARAREGLPNALAVVEAWAAQRDDVVFHAPDAGAMGWLELRRPGVTGRPLAERLIRDFETLVAPGDFFGDPCGVRLGYGGRSPGVLHEALDRIGAALDAGPTGTPG